MTKSQTPNEEQDLLEEHLKQLIDNFGLTVKVVAKADRNRDIWEYIDQLRQLVYNLHELDLALNRKINGVKNAAVTLDDSGIYEAYQRKEDRIRAKRLAKWWDAARGPLAEILLKWGLHIFWAIVTIVTAHVTITGLKK